MILNPPSFVIEYEYYDVRKFCDWNVCGAFVIGFAPNVI